MNPLWVSRAEAAKSLGISLRKLDYLLASKDLSSRQCGRRRMVPVKALEAFATRDHPAPSSGARGGFAREAGRREESA